MTSLGLLAVAWIVPQTNDLSKNFAYLMRPNFGLSEECEYKGPFKPKIECQNSQEPKILVWGDSYAMHLVAGIVASTDLGVVQATRSVCGPILDLAPVNDLTETPTWGEDCIVFNRDVLQYLSQSKSIDTVVLASPFWTYLPPEIGAKQWRNLRLTNGRHTVDDPDPERVKLALKETVEQIRGLGKKVIIVAPPPSAGFDIAECLEREAVGQVVLGVHASCKINVTDYHQHKLNTLKFLAAVRKEMPMIGFDDFLCHNSLCVTKIDETLVYRDNGHLSYEGSRLLGRRMDLAGQILLKAN